MGRRPARGLRARSCIGEDPLQHRGALAQAPPPEPPRLQPVRRRRRLDRRRALGHRAARSPISRSPCCSASRARRSRPTRPRRTQNPTPETGLQRGAAAVKSAGLPRLQDPVLGRPGPRHPAVPRGPRGRRRRLPADAGRGRACTRSRRRSPPGRELGRPQLLLVRGADPGPQHAPAEAPDRTTWTVPILAGETLARPRARRADARSASSTSRAATST